MSVMQTSSVHIVFDYCSLLSVSTLEYIIKWSGRRTTASRWSRSRRNNIIIIITIRVIIIIIIIIIITIIIIIIIIIITTMIIILSALIYDTRKGRKSPHQPSSCGEFAMQRHMMTREEKNK